MTNNINYIPPAENFRQQARNHLDIIFDGIRDGGGYLELRTFTERNPFPKGSSSLFLPVTANDTSISQALDWCESQSRKGFGVFAGMNARVRESGTKKDVENVTNIFADLDFGKMGLNKLDVIEEVYELSPIKPSLVTDSGNGLHLYFFVKPTQDFEKWRAVQEALFEKFEHLGADKSVVSDWSRVLRLTPFPNWKYEKEEGGRPTNLIEFTNYQPRLSIDQLLVHFGANSTTKQKRPGGLPAKIFEGGNAQGAGRNTTLFSEAGAMRRRGYSQEEMTASLRAINENRCSPQLPDEEVVRLVDSAMRYEPESALVASAALLDTSHHSGPLFRSWGEISETHYPDLVYLITGLLRGNIGFINAVTNFGKSSLLRNLILSAAVGRPFLNLVTGGEPLRIMLLDYETPPGLFQSDINRMASAFSAEERALLVENFHTYIAGEIDLPMLNLTDESWITRLTAEVAEFKPDLIVIDTMSMAFSMKEENSNSEATNSVVKPLQLLAKNANAGILLAHHIGKSSLDEGGARNSHYRGRGASSFGGAAALAIELDKHKSGDSTLHFAKMKGVTPPDIVLKLNPDTRWFEAIEGAVPHVVADETRLKFVSLIDRQMNRAEIDKRAAKQFNLSTSTVTRLLTEAQFKGEVLKLRHGVYAPVEIPFEPTLPQNFN